MAWRPDPPHHGILDNTVPGRVTGHLTFYQKGQPITLPVNLNGDFHLDIRRTVLQIKPHRPLWGLWEQDDLPESFHGGVGDITAGYRNPMTHKVCYVSRPYIEMFIDWGRTVFGLNPADIHILQGRKWGMFSGDRSLDRIIQAVIDSHSWSVDTIGGRTVLQLHRKNGVRETQFLPAATIQHIQQVASHYRLTAPASSDDSQQWWHVVGSFATVVSV